MHVEVGNVVEPHVLAPDGESVPDWLGEVPRFDAATVLAGEEMTWLQLVERARAAGPAGALAGLDDGALVDELGRRSSRIAASMCDYLELVAEVAVRGVWADQGARTPGQWLSFELGLGASTAADHIRVGLRLRELPMIRARFAAGRISYAKVRALTRVAVPEIEGLLLMWSEHATGAQVERIVSGFRRTCGEQEAEEQEPRRLRVRRNADGTSTMTLRAPDDEIAAIEADLDRLLDLDDERQPPEEGEVTGTFAAVRDRGARCVEALMGACAAAVAAGGADTSGMDRHTLVLQMDLRDLHPPRDGGVAVQEATGRSRVMSVSVLRRLACEAGIVLVATDGASPIDVGRRQRRPSVAQRRALMVRDRSCRFPGCGARRHLHAHHVRHWADGGRTDVANLVLVCGYHHRFVHERGWQVTPAAAGTFRFAPPGGTPRPTCGTLPGIDPSSAEDAAVARDAEGVPRNTTPGGSGLLRPIEWIPDQAYLDDAVSVLHQELRAVLDRPLATAS